LMEVNPPPTIIQSQADPNFVSASTVAPVDPEN